MYIYKTTNIINNKIYIGLSTRSPEESTAYYGSGLKLNKAIQKHGKINFIKEILEKDITNKSLLNSREIYWISYYNSTDKFKGYNITEGGTGGDTITDNPNRHKILENQSIAQKKLWNYERREHFKNLWKGSNNPNYGKQFSEEHKMKISKGGIGNTNASVPCTEEKKKQISEKLKGIPMKKVTCPHCSLTGGNPIMKRYHFDNCKNKIMF